MLYDMEEDIYCHQMPLVPVGQAMIKNVMTEDKVLLEHIKGMFLEKVEFNAEEVIKTISKLSPWSKTPQFYVRLLYRTLTMFEEYELSSFLVDQLGDNVEECFKSMTTMSVLHVIASQPRPVIKLAEKYISLFPDSVTSPNELGETPLHVVLQTFWSNVEMVSLLLRRDPSCAAISAKNGKLPIHMLLSQNRENPCLSCLSLLLKANPPGCFVKVEETFTTISFTRGRNSSGLTSSNLPKKLTWTVLSRLDELVKENSSCTCEEEKESQSACKYHYFQNVSNFVDLPHHLLTVASTCSGISYGPPNLVQFWCKNQA